MNATTKATTPANYTAEQVETIKAMYSEGVAVSAIAEAIGKSTRSIVAKLSAEKVYKSAPKVSKVTGDKAMSKDAFVAEIEQAAGFEVGELETLEKSNKVVLAKILAFVNAGK